MHIFGYLKEHPKRKLGFDPGHTNIDKTRLCKFDWENLYRVVEEAIPGDIPEPCGNLISTHCFVYANHGGNKVNRRSQTGILLFFIWHLLSCSENGMTQLKQAHLAVNSLH